MPDAGKNRSCVYLGDQQGQAGDGEDAPRRVQRRHEELHEPELGVVARQPHAPVDTGEVRREVVRVHGRDGRQRHGGHGEPRPAGPAARGQRREARRQEQRRERVRPRVPVLPPAHRQRRPVQARLPARGKLHHGRCRCRTPDRSLGCDVRWGSKQSFFFFLFLSGAPDQNEAVARWVNAPARLQLQGRGGGGCGDGGHH